MGQWLQEKDRQAEAQQKRHCNRKAAPQASKDVPPPLPKPPPPSVWGRKREGGLPAYQTGLAGSNIEQNPQQGPSSDKCLG